MTLTTTPTLTDPSKIVDIAIGHMAAKQLAAAVRLGIFRAIRESGSTLDEITRTTGLERRMSQTLVNAMTALGLLRRDGEVFSLSEESSAYLGDDAGLDLSPFVSFLEDVSYPQWLGYSAAVATATHGELDLDEDGWAGFLEGVMTYNALHAAMFGTLVRSDATRALDFGGLSAGFSIELLKNNPALHTTFVYDPAFAESTRGALAEVELSDRTTVIAAPTDQAVPDGSYDLILATHLIHRFDAETNRTIMRRLADVAEPGAQLMLLDFFLDDTGEQRTIDALHAGEYFIIDGTIVYPLDEVRAWLRDAGWVPGELVDLPGSPRVLMARRA